MEARTIGRWIDLLPTLAWRSERLSEPRVSRALTARAGPLAASLSAALAPAGLLAALAAPGVAGGGTALVPVPGEEGAQFGFDVATDGATVVVGALRRDGALVDQGAAYVYEDGGSGLVETAVLRASDPLPGSEFGFSVAVQGERILVGARKAFGGANLAGAVYVFERAGSAWVETAKLVATDAGASAGLGYDVDLDGERIVAGAPGFLFNSGAAYLFRLHEGAWYEEEVLRPADQGEGRQFGNSVAIEGTTVAVGSRRASGAAGASGAVYVFGWPDKNWTQEAELFPRDAPIFASVGESVSLDAGRLVVGVPGGPFPGAVVVYEPLPSLGGPEPWSEVARLVPPDGFAADEFGFRVAHAGDTVVVGARHDDDLGTRSGSAYVFQRAHGSWCLRRKLVDPLGAAGDEYGKAVALAGPLVVVGAHFAGPAGFHSGSARVEPRPAPEPGVATCAGDGSLAPCPCGNAGGPAEGCAHSGGHGAALHGCGSESVAADDLVLVATGLPPKNGALFFAGTVETLATPFFDGLRCVGGEVRRFRPLFQEGGTASDTGFGAQDPSGALFTPGAPVVFQLWSRDVAAGASPCGSGAALSAGYRVVLAP